MSVVFRAEDEPVASRADYWRHVSADTLVPVDLRVLDAPDFRSRILTGVVGAVRVTEVTAPRAELARTARLIRRSDPELYKIDVLVRGAAVVEQGGREAACGRVTSPWSTCHGPPAGPTRPPGWSPCCSRARCCRCPGTRWRS